MRKIKVVRVGDNNLVWDSDDCYELHTQYRIIGRLVGSLPQFKQQNQFYSLPLSLLNEEVLVGLKQGFIELVDGSGYQPPTSGDVDEFMKNRDREYEEQRRILDEERKRKREEWMNVSPAKTKKTEADNGSDFSDTTNTHNITNTDNNNNNNTAANTNKTNNTNTTNTNNKNANTSTNDGSIHIHTKNFRTYPQKEISIAEFGFPNTEMEKVKFRVFEDLYSRGYFMTSASKFGGDFLAYPGDPLRHHAYFVVYVVLPHSPISALEMIGFGRLGVSVKKSPIYATLENDKVKYITVDWQGVT